MLWINGNPMEKAIGKTILEVLQSEGYQVERVIAELNEDKFCRRRVIYADHIKWKRI